MSNFENRKSESSVVASRAVDNARTARTSIINPYGGHLINLCAGEDERHAVMETAKALPFVQLSPRSVCDLELLATGAFSPLDRFMGRHDYESVLREMRLANGMIFPIPVTLPVHPEPFIVPSKKIALRSPKNELLAVMTIEEVFPYNPQEEARHVYGTTDPRHPLVAEVAAWGPLYVSGPLKVVSLPLHYDFAELRLTPAETRHRFERMAYANVVAFQTRNPMHRAHEWITKQAAHAAQGALLLHPVVGLTKPGDVDHYTRVQCYKALVGRYYDSDRTLLSLLPLAMRLAGPREAVWHGVIRRNYGANYFIVGRDHASPGRDSAGRPFYGPYDPQELFASVEAEIGVKMVPFDEVVYLSDEDRYEEARRVPLGRQAWALSGTEVREKYLANGQGLPTWFTRSEVAEILARAYPPREQQGFCVWLTGLPCAGKSTIAEAITAALMEQGRSVSLLDGDEIRTLLSKGLGFSREDRDLNILRIGFVAAEVVRHHGVAIVAAISPYEITRQRVRAMVGGDHFIVAHVNTPLGVCERRDTKGQYARARRGEIHHFTGIDDLYEDPKTPDLILSTIDATPEECAGQIVRCLMERGFLAPKDDPMIPGRT